MNSEHALGSRRGTVVISGPACSSTDLTRRLALAFRRGRCDFPAPCPADGPAGRVAANAPDQYAHSWTTNALWGNGCGIHRLAAPSAANLIRHCQAGCGARSLVAIRIRLTFDTAPPGNRRDDQGRGSQKPATPTECGHRSKRGHAPTLSKVTTSTDPSSRRTIAFRSREARFFAKSEPRFMLRSATIGRRSPRKR